MKLRIIFVSSVLVAALFCGCSSTRHVITGTNREAVKVEDVKVYPANPPGGEQVAIVSTSKSGKGQGAMDKAMKALKKRAASLGANGLVMGNVSVHKGFILYGPWFIPQDETSVSCSAIYVPASR